MVQDSTCNNDMTNNRKWYGVFDANVRLLNKSIQSTNYAGKLFAFVSYHCKCLMFVSAWYSKVQNIANILVKSKCKNKISKSNNSNVRAELIMMKYIDLYTDNNERLVRKMKWSRLYSISICKTDDIQKFC